MMIIYIAGLQAIPDSLIEAAQIDGAKPLQTLFKIKLPMVMSSITICVFLTLTNSFKLFDQNMALTNGEPMNTTTMLALNIYNTAYQSAKFGPAQAKAVIFFICIAIISVIQLSVTKKAEVEA